MAPDRIGCRDVGAGTGSVWDWMRLVWGVVIATSLIVAAGFAALVAARLRSITRGERLAAGAARPADDRTRPPAEPDGSVFRIGRLGAPPPFLSERSGIAIAEMIGVRLGGADPRRLDAQRTIEQRIRDGDPSLIVMARRREMPSILLLHDTTADSQHWNTLPDEFASILERRGVPVDRVGYPGTLHQMRDGLALPRRAAQVLEEAIVEPGWTVTTIFGDATSLLRPDRLLLRRAADDGPVVFLDGGHPSLWDAHHEMLVRMRVDVVPATAEGLRSALARAFNPHLGDPAPPILPKPSLERPYNPLDNLDIAHRDWASDCALVEPVSFALAVRLRHLHEELRSDDPSLDFALLASLPGSWVGPGGLRFDPSLQRHLLNRLGERGADERNAAMAVIDGAFDEAERALRPEKIVSARAVLDFARNAARIVALGSDEAWAEIVALEDAKLMAKGVTANLLDQLRLPEHRHGPAPDLADPEHTEAIVLAEEPQTGAMRQALHGQALRRRSTSPVPGPSIVLGQWMAADVLDRIVAGRTKVSALSELLPWHWNAAQEAAAA